MPIRVTIADDHKVLTEGLSGLLHQHPDLELAGIAHSGAGTLALLRESPSDILLLDINLPDQSGLEVCKTALKEHPNLRVIGLSMHQEARFVSGMVQAGASGYLLKNTGEAEIVEAIRKVHAGGQYFCRFASEALAQAKSGAGAANALRLSRREKEVLGFILAEFTTQEIAQRMNVSINTVESHRRNLLTKTGARNVAGLVKIAIEKNLLDEA